MQAGMAAQGSLMMATVSPKHQHHRQRRDTMRMFSEIRVGQLFTENGNTYRKRSTRTAEIVEPELFAGRWFYFRPYETCYLTGEKA
jgi:hypothetical protein